MEFEDQEEQEEELCMGGASYDPLANPTRMKMPGGTEPVMAAQPVRSSTNGGAGRARYRECLKNHAVGIGGHALDGCGEFMPAGTEGTLDALKCAACSCHRNFHRKETDAVAMTGDPYLLTHHAHLHPPPPPPQFAAYYRTPAGYLHVGGQQRATGTLALPSTSGGGGTQSTREDQEDVSNPSAGGTGSKKRFRTKFTQEQKDKMLDLAEKLGWRIQKHDQDVVQAFCNETGVKRHVLKVWMHNNKHTLVCYNGGDAFGTLFFGWMISDIKIKVKMSSTLFDKIYSILRHLSELRSRNFLSTFNAFSLTCIFRFTFSHSIRLSSLFLLRLTASLFCSYRALKKDMLLWTACFLSSPKPAHYQYTFKMLCLFWGVEHQLKLRASTVVHTMQCNVM
ncbi:Zinc-finger homeodomain protein 1, partial [Mucuna pruriens]